MKIALYIEDGLEQIVLTPETDTEKKILGKFHDGDRELTVARGSFYACRGGWVRQRAVSSGLYWNGERDDDESTMLVLRAPTPPLVNGEEAVGAAIDAALSPARVEG